MAVDKSRTPSFRAVVPCLGTPFPPPGPRGSGSPFSSVLRRALTPRAPSRRASFPSVGGTTVRPFAMQARQARLTCAASGSGPLPDSSVESTRSPRFLGSPLVYAPCSQTPARPGRQVMRRPDVAFRGCDSVGPRGKYCSRGSIARPAHSLSTLHSRGRPRTMQDSLPVGDQPCPGGVRTRRTPTDGFLRSGHSRSSISKLCPAHRNCVQLGERGLRGCEHADRP